MESFDFIFETNILGLTFLDATKTKYPETFTSVNIVIQGDRSVCGVYTDLNDFASASRISLIYHITISMTTFNLLARIQYLSTFFRVW